MYIAALAREISRGSAYRWEGALCAEPDARAEAWDSPAPWVKAGTPRPLQVVVGALMCADCPLAAQCARAAMGEAPTGVVRAGVVVGGTRVTPWMYRVWSRLERGAPVLETIAAASPWWDPEAAAEWAHKRRPWPTEDLLEGMPPRAREWATRAQEGALPAGGGL